MHFITLLSLGYKGPPNMAQGTCVWVSQFGGGLAKKSQKCAESNIMCVFKEKLKGNSFLIEEQEGVVPHSEDVLQSIL